MRKHVKKVVPYHINCIFIAFHTTCTVVAKTEPETEPTTHHIQNTAEPAKVSSTEKPKINGQRTTVPTEAVIKSAAINELEDDLEITVKKLIKEPEPGAITTRTLEPEVKTTRTPESKVKTNEFKGEVEITVEKVTREPEPATKSTPAPEPEIQTSNALKVEELESETGGGPQEETKITIEKISEILLNDLCFFLREKHTHTETVVLR